MIDDAAYLQTQMQLLTLGGLVRGMPLREFLSRIDRAETIGPITDPTLFRAAGAQLAAVKDLAEGLLAFQRIAERLAEGPK